jgi:hypothetical protein
MNKIEFVCTVPGLKDIKELQPKPAKHFMPKWFKDVPMDLPMDMKAVPGAFSGDGVSSVKHCPSFPDYFSLGYIIPMWCDSKLYVDPETQAWNWKTSTQEFGWDIHGQNQFTRWANPSLQGEESNFVFKASCPWRIITPKGWSVLQLPLFYHFNQKWSVLPGVIDTDIHHEINQQVLYHGKGGEIQIDRGDPFVLYIPYERKSRIGLEIREASESDKKKFRVKDVEISTKFPPNGLYRKWQRERDKNNVR